MRGVLLLVLLSALALGLSMQSDIGAKAENISEGNTSLITWIGIYDEETDSTNETSSLFSVQDIFFIAYYNSSGQSITNASCIITFDGSYTVQMNYTNTTSSPLYYTEQTMSPGTHHYNISCSAAMHDTLSTEANFTVSGTFRDSGLAATGVQYSSLVWGDMDDDNDWDLIYTGYDMGLSYIQYCENTGTLSCTDMPLPMTVYGSISLGDIDNDRDLDLAISGNIGSRILRVYENSGGNLSVRDSLTGTYRGSTMLFDMDDDADLDLLNTGTRNSTHTGSITQLYQGNLTGFSSPYHMTYLHYSSITPMRIWGSAYTALLGSDNLTFNYGSLLGQDLQVYQDIVALQRSSATPADFNNDGLLDMVVTGSTTTDETGATALVYMNNGSHMVHHANLTGAYQATAAAADYNNDGFMDIVIVDSRNAIFYTNNGTGFKVEEMYDLPTASFGSAAFFDYDDDGDADLAFSGGGNMILLENNASLFRPNSKPLPPLDFNSSLDSEGLHLSWSRGSDDITPADGLYYNLRLGTLPGQYDIISGKYGGSSNPTQGYLGNMMQQRDYTVNLSQNRTYYFQVQAIDGTLRPGNWSEEQVFDPYDYTGNTTVFNVTSPYVLNCSAQYQDIHIYSDLTVMGCNILINGSIWLFNGSLWIEDTDLSSDGIHAEPGTTIHVSRSEVDNLYLNTTAGIQNSVLHNLTAYADDLQFHDSLIGRIENYGSNQSLINTSFLSADIISGYLRVMYYLELLVASGNKTLGSAQATVWYSGGFSEDQTTDASGTAGFTLTSYTVYDGLINHVSDYAIDIVRNNYITRSVEVNLTSNTFLEVQMNRSPIPDTSGFDISTDFVGIPDLENVREVFIGNQGLGLINYTQPVNVSYHNLTDLIGISHNRVEVEPTDGINRSAILTLYNLSFQYTPVPMKDGQVCTGCTPLLYETEVTPGVPKSNFSFSVPGFSTYTAGANSVLYANVSNGISEKFVPGDIVQVNVTYANRTSSEPISGTCILDTDLTSNNLLYDGETYYGEHTIPALAQPGYTLNYTITCQSAGFETLNVSDNITLVENVTLLTPVMELEGLQNQASIVFSKHIKPLVFTSGWNYSMNHTYLSSPLYNITDDVLTLQQRLISGISRGSVASADIDNDDILEIIQIGYVADYNYPLMIYEKI